MALVAIQERSVAFHGDEIHTTLVEIEVVNDAKTEQVLMRRVSS